MSELWYVAQGGHQIGPIPAAEVEAMIRNGGADLNTHVFTSGMGEWVKVRDVPQFANQAGQPAVPSIPAPPGREAHEIDFTIEGTEMQFVEVQLDPGESAVAEAGAMMYMSQGIHMETVFGDGSSKQPGIVGSLLGAGKRLLTGESLFMTVFTNQGAGRQKAAFAAPYAGKILAMDLSAQGGELICQKDAFLCAAKGVSIGIAFQKRIGAGLFGGEGFIMQRLEGDGLSFLHAGGTVHMLDLAPGEQLRVDTGYLVALQPSVTYDVQFERVLRGRGSVLRPSEWTGACVAPVAPTQPAGRPDLQGGPSDRWPTQGRGLGPRSHRRARRPDRRPVGERPGAILLGC